MKAKVSVIVPIFNVERFIERCVTTLFEQTLDEVEYIFVDDCSPDNSISILYALLDKYPLRKVCTKVIRHSLNKGLPSARNSGLAVAIGEYVFHCDSDDYVEPSMLEELYSAAKENDADWVWCDWYLSFEQNERYMIQPRYDTAEEALKSMLVGSMKYNVWNKLAKRSLYEGNQIRFPDGHGMGEDMTMIRLATCAKTVVYVPRAFYHYVRINTEAYTQNLSNNALADIRYNVNKTLKFLSNNYNGNLSQEIAYFKLNIKLPFLISNDKKQYDLWSSWYSEATAYIFSNNQLPLRTKLLQWMAWKKQFWYICL